LQRIPTPLFYLEKDDISDCSRVGVVASSMTRALGSKLLKFVSDVLAYAHEILFFDDSAFRYDSVGFLDVSSGT
jgi:hypothetical protein